MAAEETHSLISIPGPPARRRGGFLAGADKKCRSGDTRIADTTSYDGHTFTVFLQPMSLAHFDNEYKDNLIPAGIPLSNFVLSGISNDDDDDDDLP